MSRSNWMMNKGPLLAVTAVVLFLAGCYRPLASSPTPDLFATLQASTPALTGPAGTSSPGGATGSSTSLVPSAGEEPGGHIVFTCQLFKVQAMDQICIMNADGSGMRRLTTQDNRRHFYPSLAPDGQSVLYSSFREQNVYEIYSLDLKDGTVTQLTERLGVLTAPEVSPDGSSIAFVRGNPQTGSTRIMVMGRDGSDPRDLPGAAGWDPTWSPEGGQILFASTVQGTNQLFVVDRQGGGLRQVSDLPAIRGRSDWSPDGQHIVTYSGPAWHREVFLLNADGSQARQLTPAGGNSQGPSFSPDGQWVAFTAYFDNYGDDHGCEIYIIRTNGTDLRRLTDNDYCDYQPRWGP